MTAATVEEKAEPRSKCQAQADETPGGWQASFAVREASDDSGDLGEVVHWPLDASVPAAIGFTDNEERRKKERRPEGEMERWAAEFSTKGMELLDGCGIEARGDSATVKASKKK